MWVYPRVYSVQTRLSVYARTAIGDDNEVGTKRLHLIRALPARAYTDYAAREWAFDQVRYGCFKEVDTRCGPGVCTEVLNETGMVESASAALSTARIWDVHDLSSGVEDCGGMHGDAVDAVRTIAETE